MNITVDEYQHRSVALTPEVATALAAAGGDRLRVLATGAPGVYDLQATQYVGAIVTPV